MYGVNHGLAVMEWISHKRFSDPFVSLRDLHLLMQIYIKNVGKNHLYGKLVILKAKDS